jgi:hypothetical protein
MAEGQAEVSGQPATPGPLRPHQVNDCNRRLSPVAPRSLSDPQGRCSRTHQDDTAYARPDRGPPGLAGINRPIAGNAELPQAFLCAPRPTRSCGPASGQYLRGSPGEKLGQLCRECCQGIRPMRRPPTGADPDRILGQFPQPCFSLSDLENSIPRRRARRNNPNFGSIEDAAARDRQYARLARRDRRPSGPGRVPIKLMVPSRSGERPVAAQGRHSIPPRTRPAHLTDAPKQQR